MLIQTKTNLCIIFCAKRIWHIFSPKITFYPCHVLCATFKSHCRWGVFLVWVSSSLQIVSLVSELHGKNKGSPNRWIIGVKIVSQLSRIHLFLHVKSSQILGGWHVNKWLRLTDPNQEPEAGDGKPPQYCPTTPWQARSWETCQNVIGSNFWCTEFVNIWWANIWQISITLILTPTEWVEAGSAYLCDL